MPNSALSLPAPRRVTGLPAYLQALALVAFFGSLGVVLTPWLGEGYASLVFVLGISVVGALHGMAPALVSAAVSAVAFDFFVSEPVFELTLNRTADIAPPVVFTLCAVISGWMSGRLRDEATRASLSNRQLESLLEVSRQLQRANNDAEVLAVLSASFAAVGAGRLGLYRGEGADLAPVADSPREEEWRALARRAACGGVEWEVAAWPLVGCRLMVGTHVIGALLLEVPETRAPDNGFLLAQARMAALVLERIDLSLQLSDARAAARTEELKTALLASVSHDLRSPLTAISTSAASLLAFGSQFDSETSQQLLSGIVEESSRLNHLTSNLLQMTRLQSGEEGLYWVEVPVVETLHAIVARRHALTAGRRITIAAGDAELLVRADTALFDLVMTNVLQNAARYSSPDTPISVACTVEDGFCVIAVSDEGIGIPPSEQERVFERFYRVERGDRGPRGTGLGLAIARGFVNACGGSIAIVSPRPQGVGTTITIRLPLAGEPCRKDQS